MKTKNLAVGVLAAVLTVALWYTYLLKPTRSQASKVRSEAADEQAKLEPLQGQLAKARRDASHAATFKAQLASLQLAMPNSPALAEFIRDANGIAQASSVVRQSVTHGTPTPGADGVTAITLGIQVKGTYPQVIDYLARLSQLQRLVVVDGVQFATAGTTGTDTGGGSNAGQSTGPFSGANQLTLTVTARMFETPGALVGSGTAAGGSTLTTSSAGATSPAPLSKPSTLNNS